MKTVGSYSKRVPENLFVWKLLQQWTPVFERTGKDQQADDLFDRLQKYLPEVPVIRETQPGNPPGDIVIQDTYRVIAMPALAAADNDELNRRKDEILQDMKQWVDLGRGPAYLVIVGQPEPGTRAALEAAVEQLDSGYLTEWFFLMFKEPPANL